MRKPHLLKHLPTNATYGEMKSPAGPLTIITSPQGLHAVLWDIDREALTATVLTHSLKKSKDEKILLQTKKQLSEYFEGKRKTFDLPLILNGTTFQLQAWQQLSKIPYATTISYAKQAERIGDKKKARAIGSANGMNPISIVIPCHRVIGSNGKLVGFGGGIERKALLLQLEANHA